MEVTIGEMTDKLSIINIKMFFLENVKRDSKDDKEIADATRKTNDLNTQRNTIISEIDLALNRIAEGQKQKLFGANKMYGNDKK